MTVRAVKRMLVIDDEEAICTAFRRFFERRGWTVQIAASAAQGLSAFSSSRPDVVFLDVRLPDGDGLEVLHRLRSTDAGVPVIVITAYGILQTVVDSVAGEAFEYLPKPIDLDHAQQLVERAIESRETGVVSGADLPDDETRGVEMVGASPAMQKVFKRIAVLSRTDCSVLILGATGTGKEMVAQAIHHHSSRGGGPFIALNCGAVPENLVESELFGHMRGAFTGANADHVGKFEAADGGTIFLDEIGELPNPAQVKLLRVLDSHIIEPVGSTRSRELDVRVMAATNHDLPEDVHAGRFRPDLYYRLAVVQVELPPLAERPEDILPLAEHFLASSARSGRPVPGLTEEAKRVLLDHTWPGNVRELKNAVAHALAVAPGGPIQLDDLPQSVRSSRGARGPGDGGRNEIVERYIADLPEGGDLHARAIRPVDEAIVRFAMSKCGSNQSETAALLGLHRNTLRRKLKEFGIE